MPDILTPLLDGPSISLPNIPTQMEFPHWDRPTVTIPDVIKQSQQVFSQYPSDNIPVQDFNKIVGDVLTPEDLKKKIEDQKVMASLVPNIAPPTNKPLNFRYFSTSDALRYKQNDRLWSKIGYNPELPYELMEAQYDYNESRWESIKNIAPKFWATAKFQFDNYFQEYLDTAEAIGKLDYNVLQNQSRFGKFSQKLKDLEDLYPDYATDRPTKWWQIFRGDTWEESASSLGFTVGTIGAALLENAVVTAATAGIGEIPEIYNTPRKIFNAISDYYSLRRAYGLVKAAVGAKKVTGFLGAGANVWRLTNGALAEATYDVYSNSAQYKESFIQDYVNKHGFMPTKDVLDKLDKSMEKANNLGILLQTPFLMASNAAQFGNLIAPKGFPKLMKDVGLEKPLYKFIVDKQFKVGVEATEEAIKNPLLRHSMSALKGINQSAWQGVEESYQGLVTKSTEDYYKKKIVDKSDPTVMGSLGVGFDYITSNEGMKEFSAGFATGAIFQHAGRPLSYLVKPKLVENPETKEKEYKLNIFNKFGIGMNAANKDIERRQYEKIAKRLNEIDVEKVLKEQGLFDLIKDKRTQFALAKYVENNDLFNMKNVQNLQLNRMFYTGLETGKIDLQVRRLKDFALQDFNTLKTFFKLEDADYQTPEEQQAFLDNFRSFTNSLDEKSKEFEKIFNTEKTKHQDILESSANEYTAAVDSYNSLVTDLKAKYKVNNVDELNQLRVDGKIEQADIDSLADKNGTLLGTKFTWYGIKEGVKASVFAQVGMMEDARRANDTLGELSRQDGMGLKYNSEISRLFDKTYREDRIKQLETKLSSVTDDAKKLVQEQLDNFKKLSDELNANFEEGVEINDESVAKAIQKYFYSLQKELNKLDNSSEFDARVSSEEARQFQSLREFVKLQKQQQANLDLLNYLSAGDNFEEYAKRQSDALRSFFVDAVDIAEKDEQEEAAKTAPPPVAATPPEKPEEKPAAPTPAPVASTATARPAAIKSAPSHKDALAALMEAIRSKDADEVARLSEILKSADPKFVLLVRGNYTRMKAFSKVADEIDAVIKNIVGEAAFNAYVNPPLQPVAKEEEEEEQQPEKKQEPTPVEKTEPPTAPTDKEVDIERRRQEELDNITQPVNRNALEKSKTPMPTEEETLVEANKIISDNKTLVDKLEDRNTSPEEWDRLADELSEKFRGKPADWKFENGRVIPNFEKVNHTGINTNYSNATVDRVGKYQVGDKLQVNNGSTALPAVVTKVSETGRVLEAETEGTVVIRNGVVLTANEVQNQKEINARYDAELAALEPTVTEHAASPEIIDVKKEATVPTATPVERPGDKLRKLKINTDNNTLQTNIFGIPIAIINGLIETIASAVDAGTELSKAIREAIRGIKDEYPGFQEKEFTTQVNTFMSTEPTAESPILAQPPIPPVEVVEGPPTANIGSFTPDTGLAPVGKNIISFLIDKAREAGSFIFDSVNPKEIDKVEDDKMTLRTNSDPELLRHHYIIEKITNIIDKDDTGKALDDYKLKLEILNEDNEKWFYKRDKKSNSVLAVMVDSNNNYIYFDSKGDIVDKNSGKPFALEYEDTFYTSAKLGISRNSLAKGSVPTAIQPNYNGDVNPLMTVVSLLRNNVPVTAKILGITAGTLSTNNNNNTLATEKQPESTYKMRTVKELFDSGELNPQLVDVKIDGFYLDTPAGVWESGASNAIAGQRVKVGRPYLYDVKSNLFIPLTGKKLRDVTFDGTPIDKGSQLYEIIDVLNTTGEVGFSTLRADKTRMFVDHEQVLEVYKFLRNLLYRRNFPITLEGETIRLNRNNNSLKANSVWDAEINYVKDFGKFFSIPLTKTGEDFMQDLPYSDFVNENFLTGAVQAQIAPGDTRFTKINKRVIFQLDKNYSQLREEIANGVQKAVASSQTPEVGDQFSPASDLSRVVTVVSVEDDIVTLRDVEGEKESRMQVEDLLKRWKKIEKIAKPEPVKMTEKQELALAKIPTITADRTGGQRTIEGAIFPYSVTGLIRPTTGRPKESSAATVVGNAIDHVAKTIFSGGKVSGGQEVNLNGLKAKLGSYFKSPAHLDSVADAITRVKNRLDEQGYVYKTNILVYDKETGISGEIDLLLIGPDGTLTVADFKTSNTAFKENYLGRVYDGVSNTQYFATQGYIYGLLLGKMTGLPVSDSNTILGFDTAYTDEKNIQDTKVVAIRDAKDYVFKFKKSDIVPWYTTPSGPMSTLREIRDAYDKMKAQDSTPGSLTGRKKRDDTPLLMKIEDIRKVAATRPELQAEIDHMSNMMGEEFVVNFVNAANSYKYGEFNVEAVTLYENAIRGTVYHEGWHKFSQLFLTIPQKISLYQSLRDQAINYTDRGGRKRNTSTDTDMDVEEMLADEWVKFVQAPKEYRFPRPEQRGVLSLFKRIWRALKEWWSGTKNPDKLFRDLYTGNLKGFNRDIDNAMWGNLASAVVDKNGKEIINHSRTGLYTSVTSYFIGDWLRTYKLSFTWLSENLYSNAVKDGVWTRFDNLQTNRLSKLVVPATVSTVDRRQYVMENVGSVIEATVKQKGIRPEVAAKYVAQILEIEAILADDAFDNFYKYYTQNSDVDSIRDRSNRDEDITPTTFDSEEIKKLESEYSGDTAQDEEDALENGEEGADYKTHIFGKGPNEESALNKASRAVQDWFRTMPVVMSVKEDGSLEFLLNELDIPETYDYAALFDKVKTILAGDTTIEDVLSKLSNPLIQKDFPQTRFIFDRLNEIIKENTAENFSFIQQFVRVMGLPEVSNIEVSVNFDAVAELATGTERTITKMRELSRIGEAQEVAQWQHSFKRASEGRTFTVVGDNISLSDIFNNKDTSNILYKIGGVVVLNPFYDYESLNVSTQEFLTIMGINLDKRFWENSESVKYAVRFKSLFLKNLQRYNEYSQYILNQEFTGTGITVEDLKASTQPNREVVEQIIKALFIENPIRSFRERRTYRMGDKSIEINSMFPVMEDLSRANSIYSLTAASRSFTTGDGKIKWPFYEHSLISYRTHMLNKINNIKEFNEHIEYSFLNPNTQPWLKNSFFYQRMFDDRGNRRTISDQLKNSENASLSSRVVKLQMADLSTYRTVMNRNYRTVHPKKLNALDKMFFDTVTLLTDGYIEIPRAATSSSMFAVKLNSYGATARGTNFESQFLPVDYTGISLSNSAAGVNINFPGNKFPVIMQGYLASELHKMKWYFDRNPGHSLANDFNIFKDILDEDLANRLRQAVRDITSKNQDDIAEKVKKIVSDNKDEVNSAIRRYFSTYVQDLYNGKRNSSYMNMSSSQKAILKNLMNLYQNRARSTDKEDIQREKEIAEDAAARGQSSVYQGVVEKANLDSNDSLARIAATFAVNQFILNVEYHTWYMGDNYLFSNPFKRGNLTTNTGILGIVSDSTNAVLNATRGDTLYSLFTGNKDPKDFKIAKTHVIKDVVTNSRNIPIMVTDLINYELRFKRLTGDQVENRRKELTEMLGAYSRINAADGQSKISLDAYRTFRKIFGEWSNKDEKEYQRQLAITRLRLNLYDATSDKLEALRKKDEDFIKKGPYSTFNPQKWSYTGPEILFDEKGNQILDAPMRTKFDKTSLHPLIPEMLIGSGLADEQLLVEMAKNDIDYVKFESAAKGVKHENILEYFDGVGNINEKDVKLEDASAEWLLSTYVKRQLSTDGEQRENTLGSQQRVMVFDVKYLPEIQGNPKELAKILNIEQKYHDAVEGLMGFQRAEFLNRFGLEEKGKGQNYEMVIADEGRFAAAINSLAKSNNFPSNMLEYLKYNPSSESYTYDPSLVFNRKMLIDTIGGIIDNDLRRIKTKGVSAIQVTSVGNTKHKFTNPTEEQVRQYGTNGLHFYHYIYDDQGNIVKTSTMGIKMTLQGDFKNLLKLKFEGKTIGTLENLNKAIQNKDFREANIDKLTAYAYRIPSNNNNFIDHVEIMEFLPESAGNIVIAPPEHITKSGSDFDVDKLQFILPSIEQDGSLVAAPTKPIKEIYDEVNAITDSIRDFREKQKTIKKIIKKERKDYKDISNNLERVDFAIRNEWMKEDASVYNGMVMGKSTFYEIRSYFEPLMQGNEQYEKHMQEWEHWNGVLQNELDPTAQEDRGLRVNNEFDELLNNIGRYKSHYTNQMLFSLKEILSHPTYLQMLVAPSNADYLTAEAKRIGALTGRTLNDGLSSTANMKYTIVNAKQKEYLTDSGDIGAYSRQRIWYSFLNYTKMTLNRTWRYGEAPMRIHTPLAPRDKVSDIADYDNIFMYGDNVDGVSPRDLWDQLMTLTLDLPSNSSYTLFGINKHNKKAFLYLISSRYSIPSILNFLNQPILQEVYNTYDRRVNELANYSIKHAMYEVAKSWGITSPKLATLYKEVYEKSREKGREGEILGANVFVKRPGIAANELITDDDHFSTEQMEADIVAENRTTAAYKDRQKKILLYFMSMEMEAANLTGMEFTYSEDRSKNTNYFTIQENELRKESIRGDEYNDLPVDNSMFSKEAIKKLETKSIYSMFTYGNVAKLLYERFAKEFTDLKVSTSIMKLLNASNTFSTDRQLLATRIEGDFIEFIYKNFGIFDTKIYDPFTDTVRENTERFSSHFIQNIFNINKDPDFKTYEDKFTTFLRKYPELLERIAFVQKLYPAGLSERSKENVNINELDTFDASVMRFSRSQENTIQERNFYSQQFENLINFKPEEFKLTENYSPADKEKISLFFTELAYLTLYQSGPTNIADNFSDLIPSSLWQKFSSTAFNNYRKAVESGKISKDTLLKMFNMMYIENNPKVPWKSPFMVYSIQYFQENLRAGGKYTKTDQENARKARQETQYFQNFTAGKMYDIQLFANKLKFKVAKDLNC